MTAKFERDLLLSEGCESVKDGDGKDQARADEGRHSGAHKNCRQRKSSENKQKLGHLKNKEKR